MKIHIVCYEDPTKWICGKIARRLQEELVALGHECRLGGQADATADVNHHVIYLNYPGSAQGVHTLMVTHIDEAMKLRKLEAGLATARAAICMSAESVQRLVQLGLPSSRLAHVPPASDGQARPRRLVIGLTTRLYPDGRKREQDLLQVCRGVSPDDFTFRIMGHGWAEIVGQLRARGFSVDYREEFEYAAYLELMGSLDYYLYLSGDEGSMGFVDALAAGVKTIVQPQGFHLDAPGGITHAFTNVAELEQIFAAIAAEKRRLQAAVQDWTWRQCALRHVAVWESCVAGRPLMTPAAMAPAGVAWRLRARLWANAFLHRLRLVRNLRKDFDVESAVWQRRRQKAQEKK